MSDKSKATETINNTISSMPESFYDVIAYIFPGTILYLLWYLLINDYEIDFLEYIDLLNTSFVLDIVIGIFILIVLYVTGQFITPISFYFIYLTTEVLNIWVEPISKYIESKLLKKIDSPKLGFNDKLLMNAKTKISKYHDIYMRVKINHHGKYLWVTKRYSRLILTRNLCVVAWIILLMSIVTLNFNILYILFVLLTLYDFNIRLRWYYSMLEKFD